jgi:hypothetical protein
MASSRLRAPVFPHLVSAHLLGVRGDPLNAGIEAGVIVLRVTHVMECSHVKIKGISAATHC